MGLGLPNPSGTVFDPRCQPALGRAVQDYLGQHLQRIYDEIGPLPDPQPFTALVDQLERVLAARGEAEQSRFRDGILKALPSLRAFAISLTKNPDRADDLVQGTILRAFDKRNSFQPGTNLNAWLFTILRNTFLSEYRKRAREVADSDGEYAARLTTAPDQTDKLAIQDLQAALSKLPPDQREALLLVTADGLPYEEAAAICGTAVGTIKSRVNRARRRLVEHLGYTAGDLAAERGARSAMNNFQ